ncbi:MAG: hypothetical protein JO269_03260 [Burkholderiaceae bacterium]|nr:hypothetical protein [Burkholderiaceae bacterium]
MKVFKVLLLALLLCGPAWESAQAGIHVSGMGRAGSSSALRGGFSSQKSMAQHAAPTGSAQRTTFGSFGGAAASGPAGNSALSKDLNVGSANANALNTYDARNKAQRATQGAVGAPAPAYGPAPVYVPQPVIVQQHSGFFSSPWLWFWMGHSMNQDRVVVVNNGANGNNGTAGTVNPAANPATNPVANSGQVDGAVPAVANLQDQPAPSLLHSLLKTLLWAALTTAIICAAVVYFARRAVRRTNHYTL